MQQAVIADLNKAISSAVNNTLRSEMKQSVSPGEEREGDNHLGPIFNLLNIKCNISAYLIFKT